MVTERATPAVFDRIVGQEEAVALLTGSLASPVHAYLFLGPAGSGKRDAALAFAAALECPEGGCGACASCRAVVAGVHPDVVVVERVAASIDVDTAREVGALAQRSAREGRFNVVVLVDFHLVDRAAPALLKTVEEPPVGTVFLVLAESIPPELVTIASRCVRVEFRPLDPATIAAALEREGVEPAIAAGAAAGAGGRIDRARLLALDPHFAERTEWWRALPRRLDGTGAEVMAIVDELARVLGELLEVVEARQADELAALEAAAEQAGERRVVGLGDVTARHKREQRRVRTDELRAGLATLADAYRDRVVADGLAPLRRAELFEAAAAIDAAAAALVRNPTEELLIESLLLTLDEVGA